MMHHLIKLNQSKLGQFHKYYGSVISTSKIKITIKLFAGYGV